MGTYRKEKQMSPNLFSYKAVKTVYAIAKKFKEKQLSPNLFSYKAVKTLYAIAKKLKISPKLSFYNTVQTYM